MLALSLYLWKSSFVFFSCVVGGGNGHHSNNRRSSNDSRREVPICEFIERLTFSSTNFFFYGMWCLPVLHNHTVHKTNTLRPNPSSPNTLRIFELLFCLELLWIFVAFLPETCPVQAPHHKVSIHTFSLPCRPRKWRSFALGLGIEASDCGACSLVSHIQSSDTFRRCCLCNHDQWSSSVVQWGSVRKGAIHTVCTWRFALSISS